MAAAETIEISHSEGWVIARWHGEIDTANAPLIRRHTLDALTNTDLGMIVDVTAVSYIDSAGITALVSIRRMLEERQQKMFLVIPPDSKLRKALEIGGVPAVIPTFNSISEAEAAR